MFSWLRRKKTVEVEATRIGLVVGPADLTAVLLDNSDEGRPNVLAWESFPYESLADLQSGLTRFVDTHKLNGEACRCTLSSHDYSLRLVERPPNVPDDELVDATRWLIRDLIEFDVEAAQLAILTIPEDSNRARTPKMFVVAARDEQLLDLAHVINCAGLRLLGFEIVESTMLAIEERMPETVAGSAMLKFEDKTSILTLSRVPHLYLARNLNLDLAILDDAAQRALEEEDPTSPSIIDCLDPLLLDVQRSLDYYESEYGQAPASRLTLLPSAIDCTPLTPALSEALRPIQVEAFDIADYLEFAERPQDDLHQSLTLAAGSALVQSGLIGDALLPLSFRPQDGEFGLLSVCRLAAAITMLLGIYYGITLYQYDGRAAELAALETTLSDLSVQVEAAREAATVAAATSNPEAEIAALTAERNARISMFRDMTQRTSRSDASFAGLLEGLARQDLEGIWLERIEFSLGGDAIAVEGRTLDPAIIPEYLTRLGNEDGYASRRFRTFQIERSGGSEPGLAFRIATLSREMMNEGGNE